MDGFLGSAIHNFTFFPAGAGEIVEGTTKFAVAAVLSEAVMEYG
jgi:hypothetical protein